MIHSKDFKKVLRQLKVKKGASCLIHSSIINLGNFEDNNIKKIPDNIFNNLRQVIGKKGTISTLGSNYEYADKGINFDTYKSVPSAELGVFSRYLFKRKSSKRSINPIFNIISEGKYSNYITNQKTPTAFGEDSAWHQLFKLNSEIIFIGCDISVCTFIRFIEFRFGVPYLYNKMFENEVRKKNKLYFKFSSSTLRYKKSRIIYNLKKFENFLIKKGLLRVSDIQNIKIMAIKMQPLFEIGIQKLKGDIYYFLKSKPSYQKNFNPKK